MDGFEWPGLRTPNGTIIPDEIFDYLMPILTESEFKCLMYIARRTFGFKKDADTISIKQMAEGITTLDGKILDRGTGLAKASVARGVKGLVEKGIVVSVRNKSTDRGDLPTTYRIRFFGEGVSQIETRGVPQIETGGIPKRDTQQTDKQLTEGEGNSNYTDSGKNVDNLGITPYLDAVIADFSREFKDTEHERSNRQQARNLFVKSGLDEDQFVELKIYPARAATRLQTGIGNRAAYFFAVLRELCGVEKE
jgi:DNA-binding MarR family transcriptional regulator